MLFRFGAILFAAATMAACSRIPTAAVPFRDCSECPELVVLPAGTFLMGWADTDPMRNPRDGPQRAVTIQRAFAIGRFEVTFAEWDACVAGGGCNGYTPSDGGWGRGRLPVIFLSWLDATSYVEWLSRRTGKQYRLLTEAEWEYAARAGTTTPYAFGERITPAQAQYYGDTPERRTAEVGHYLPNAWGLFDMHGNVWEWVQDCATQTCRSRIVRGGSWFSAADGVRSAIRFDFLSDNRNNTYGFRVAREVAGT